MLARALLVILLSCLSSMPAVARGNDERLPDNPQHRHSQWYRLVEADHPNVFDVLTLLQRDSSTHGQGASRQVRAARRWIAERLPHADARGNIGPLRPPLDEILRHTRLRKSAPENVQSQQPQWQPLGPFGWDTEAVLQTGSQGIGVVRTHLVWPGQPELILAGTISAGIWRSTDAGRTWSAIAQDEPIQSVSRFTVANDTVYAATSAGLYVSTDTGLTFRRVSLEGDLALTQAVAVDLCAVDPNNARRVVIATIGRLFLSTDAGSTWKSASNMIGTWWDLLWHPERSEVAYGLVQIESHISFVRSTSSGVKFNPTGQGYPAARPGTSMARALLAVTPASPGMVSVMIAGSTGNVGGVYGLYVSTDEGSTFEHRCCGNVDGPEAPNRGTNPNIFDYDIDGQGLGQVTWDMGFAISSRDPQFMVAAGIFPYRSSDGGRNWRTFPPMHYDIQSASVVGDSVWLTHDGGITLSSNRGGSISERSFGISAAEVWGFDQSHDGSIMAMGAYHLPTFFRDTTVYTAQFPAGGWYPWAGADAMGANVNPVASEWIYAKPWGNVRVRRTRSKLLPPSSSELGIDLGYLTMNNIEFDPVRYFRIIAADHATQRVVLSDDNAGSWKTLKTFARFVSRVRVHPENGNHIVAIADAELWQSLDAGVSWTNITPKESVSRGQGMVDVAFDDDNSSRLYVAFGGNQNRVKVAETSDAGQTWASVSDGLPAFAIFTLVSRRGTSGELYAGTSYGVYRYTPQTKWSLYGRGLPYSDVNFLHIDDPGGRLRVATNRGLWQIDLPMSSKPRALISMDTDTIRCARQPVRFGCRSAAVETAAFRRRWQFPSGTPSESALPVVNVLYSVPGTYDVSLIVENEYGADTTLMKDAITVLPSECDVFAREAGNAADLSGAQDHVTLGRYSGIGREFSFTAWVKPVGMQPNFSAILCTDADPGVSQEIGLQFVNDRNELGYLWSGGRWWWGSGLTLRPDEWSHVALTIDSTGATVYVNGIGSKDATSLPALDLSSLVFTLGTYHYWSDRNFSGSIDEVALYSRCLSAYDVRTSMHLTRRRGDEGLMAYYQFNEGTRGVIFDKVAGRDGSYQSGSGPIPSGALVASGSSELVRLAKGARQAGFADDTVELQKPLTDDVELVMTTFDRVAGATATGQQNPLEHSWRVLNVFGQQRSVELARMRLSCDRRALADDSSQRTYGILTRSSWSTSEQWSAARINDNGFLRLNQTGVSANVDRGLLTPTQIMLTYSGLPVSVTDERSSGDNIDVGPNPASDVIHIRSGAGLRDITITGMDGRVVYQRQLNASQTEQGVDVSALEQGTYILRVGQSRTLLVILR